MKTLPTLEEMRAFLATRGYSADMTDAKTITCFRLEQFRIV
jgi:hypothetical protein